ncbi:hypothetical protein BKA67DRAFT_217800 [Truncatella angustata]|uniref:MADS-box domain-containing protein n=1 Tax=Truncatella angustata TaxID=152316 RepID=A0A9P9A2V7_9PEZI|nr:uncharacterized protein BKA67DRAFT_217800 [Truncatella angustata]KAH6658611.1 hypothetical protein BKA67DRAFT_217800 [Truncatella angustata]
MYDRQVSCTESSCSYCHDLFSPFATKGHITMFSSHPQCSQSGKAPIPVILNDTLTRQARKKAAAKFSKRRRTLVKRAHDLYRDCDAEVFLVIKKNNKLHVFNSEPSRASWPPSYDSIIKSYPLPNIQTPLTMQVSNAKNGVES